MGKKSRWGKGRVRKIGLAEGGGRGHSYLQRRGPWAALTVWALHDLSKEVQENGLCLRPSAAFCRVKELECANALGN